MVLNSLNFCLSGKLLISPSNLNKSLLAGQSILGCRFFPFITLNILCHSLLAYRVGQRNQLITWWEFPYMIFVIFPLILLEFYLCLLIFVSFFSSGFYGSKFCWLLFSLVTLLLFYQWLMLLFNVFEQLLNNDMPYILFVGTIFLVYCMFCC